MRTRVSKGTAKTGPDRRLAERLAAPEGELLKGKSCLSLVDLRPGCLKGREGGGVRVRGAWGALQWPLGGTGQATGQAQGAVPGAQLRPETQPRSSG